MKSRYPLMALVVAGLFVFSVESLFSEDTVSMSEWTQIVEKIGNNGNVNWSAGYIEAVGTGIREKRQATGRANQTTLGDTL